MEREVRDSHTLASGFLSGILKAANYTKTPCSFRAQVLGNIKDAIEGYIESLRKHGDPVPSPISEEVVEVSA